MPTLDEIQLQLQQINTPKNIKNARSIKELPKILWESEQVKKITQGSYANSIGILVATNERLLFVDKGALWGLKIESFPYNRITSIRYKTGLLLGNITIFTSGNVAEIKNVENNQCRDFCDYVDMQLVEKTDHLGTPSQESLPVDESPNCMSSPAKSSSLNTQGALNTFTKQNKIPFYKKNWFIWLMLFCIYPIGAVLMWMFSSYKRETKIIIVCIMGFFFLIVLPNETPPVTTFDTSQREERHSQSNESTNQHKQELIQWYKSLNVDIQSSIATGGKISDLFEGIANGAIPLNKEVAQKIRSIDKEYADITARMDKNHPVPDFVNEKDRKELNEAVFLLSSVNRGCGASLLKLAYRLEDGTLNPKHFERFRKELENNINDFQSYNGHIADMLKKYGIEREEIQEILNSDTKNNSNTLKSDKPESTLHKLLN